MEQLQTKKQIQNPKLKTKKIKVKCVLNDLANFRLSKF
jgi:hypothetical protein